MSNTKNASDEDKIDGSRIVPTTSADNATTTKLNSQSHHHSAATAATDDEEITKSSNKSTPETKGASPKSPSSLAKTSPRQQLRSKKKGRDGSKKGLKNIVNKVMSWNSGGSAAAGHTSVSSNIEDRKEFVRDVDAIESVATTSDANNTGVVENVSEDLENLSFIDRHQHNGESDENLFCKADWLRARDSLENLLINRTTTTSNECELSPSKSTPDQMNYAQTLRNFKNASAHSISKVLAWDPWDKLGRKGKRESKRRKEGGQSKKQQQQATVGAVSGGAGNRKKEDARKHVTLSLAAVGDECRAATTTSGLCGQVDADDTADNYTYQSYYYNRPKNVKSVDFTNEVRVVYYNADRVVGESKEPLKRELEQQIRNKEMRRGHSPTMMYVSAGGGGGIGGCLKKPYF